MNYGKSLLCYNKPTNMKDDTNQRIDFETDGQINRQVSETNWLVELDAADTHHTTVH